MSRKRTILKGTFILTLTGFTTRFMGFFYRIFLSHTFGEEGVGLYQLIFPIYALGFSLTCAGVELALSRGVARCMTKGQKKEARELLNAAMLLTISASFAVTLFLQKYADVIALHFLHDTRCAPLLVILSYLFPFAAVHSCICGFYFGQKQTRIPAVSHLIEQFIRITSVCLLYMYGLRHGISFHISIAVAGLVAGEAASSIFCCRSVRVKRKERVALPSFLHNCAGHIKELLFLSLPLTGSRVMLNILQSIEAVSIPLRLQLYGMTVKESVSTYGVLTGMALPCILFPSAITNSVSTMLLPTVAEIQTMKDHKKLTELVRKVTWSCILLGSVCCIFLLTLGNWMGATLFHSPAAGDFIETLAWMCPFLYTNNTLLSTINGIGKTNLSFLINAASLGIRIAGVFFLIPAFGIAGYLWGLLASQLSVFFFCFLYLKYYISKQEV